MRGTTASAACNLPKDITAASLTFQSSSRNVAINAGTAVESPIFPSTLAANMRTFESPSCNARVSAATTAGFFVAASVSAAAFRTAASGCLNSVMSFSTSRDILSCASAGIVKAQAHKRTQAAARRRRRGTAPALVGSVQALAITDASPAQNESTSILAVPCPSALGGGANAVRQSCPYVDVGSGRSNACASAAIVRPGTSLHRSPPTRLRRLQALVRLRLTYQRVPLRLDQCVDGEIDVEVRPVQVMRTGQLNPADLLDRGLLEPREVLERYEQLLFAHEQPKAMGRHVRDFNRGSASPKRCGFHLRAPQRVPALLRAAWP